MKKIEIIKRTPDENKELLIKAVGGYEPYKAFYAVVGDVDINTGATDIYNTKTEFNKDLDEKMSKLRIMIKFGLTLGIYNYMKGIWKKLRAKQ